MRPYFENFGKRLVKTPKIYIADTGLLCHLLGLRTQRALEQSPFIGSVFEAFVAQELIKHQIHHGRVRELYYFRDEQGLEVDFLVPHGADLALIEAKWSKTVVPRDARGIEALLHAPGAWARKGFVVHRGGVAGTALVPGIKAVTVAELLTALD